MNFEPFDALSAWRQGNTIRLLEGHSEEVRLIDCCMIVSLKSAHQNTQGVISHGKGKVEIQYSGGESGSSDCLFFLHRGQREGSVCVAYVPLKT